SRAVPALTVGSKVKARQVVSGVPSALSLEITVVAPPPAPRLNVPLVATAVHVSGSGVVGALVSVVIDGTVVGTATVAADGKWSLALDVPLSTGQIVQASQAVGGVSSALSDRATVVAPPPAPVVNSSIVAGSTSVSGTGTGGATVTVFVDGVAVGDV